MRKIYFYSILFFLVFNNSFATDWRLKVGDSISGRFEVYDNKFINLPEGEFVVVEKPAAGESINGIGVEGLSLVHLKDNVPIKWFEIARAYGLSKWTGHLNPIIEAETFKPKRNGCKKRQDYSFLKFYKRGAAHNCLIVKHFDVQRELYGSDYDEDRVFSAGIRYWVKKNNIKLPDIYLWDEHWFFSMPVREEWILLLHAETPESFADYKIKFTTRDTSEFHPDIVIRYPKAKKIMENFKKIAAKRHKNFEEIVGAKKQHLLDLSQIISDNAHQKNSKNKSGKNIVAELEKLNELYKSGALTKEEFEKAKKKILSE